MSLRLTTRKRAAAATMAVVAGALIATGLPNANVGPATAADAKPAVTLPVQADPDAAFGADLVTQVLVQPSGYRFKAKMTDLKVGGLFETLTGYGVERDAQQVWRYITGFNKLGKPMLGDEVTAARPTAGLAKHLGRRPVDLSDPELATREMVGNQLRSMTEKLAADPNVSEKAAAGPRVFYVPALMLATWYDEDTESGPTFHAPTNTPEYFKKLLDGFGGNPYGSMTQFYYEASFGQFLVRVDVYGTYDSANSVGRPCYYGSPDGVTVQDPVGGLLGVGGVGALGMAVEAVPQASDVPWGKYDNDGDGVVDFTMIIHSGGGHEVTGDACNTHSHAITASSLANIGTGLLGIDAEQLKVGIPTSTPGVYVNRVVTIPEFESSDSPLTIGVATHEMAHAIGEPDYYDTTYNSVGTGDYDIMSGGSYLGNPSGSNPAMQNPATRVFQHYVTPTIVRGSLRNYKLRPRTTLPKKGYKYGTPDPNLLLVPTYERAIGEVDSLGHEWTAEDAYGLAYDTKTKKFVVEGFYVENVSRNTTSVKLDKKNPMGSMFDRAMHSSGLAVWHFDYYKQSSTYFGGSNDAQTDPNRYQMDLEEFDQNDNTQELQLNYARGNASDLLTAAATGITSGTHLLPPGASAAKGGGAPQKPVEFSGTATPVTPGTNEFTVENNKANQAMTVTVGSDLAGDCKLQLTDPSGKAGEELDGGGPGDEETLTVKAPAPGTWTATVGDFAACGSYSGRVVFEGGATGSFSTEGAADTWSNWSKKPTGWAFTNVRGYGNGLDMNQEGGPGNGVMTLDILNLAKKKDVSPGFVVGRPSTTGGNAPIIAGVKNKMSVPIFSNGGKKPGKVNVVIREGSAKGRIVAQRSLTIGAYGRKATGFVYKAKKEGPVKLVTIVDPANRIKEGNEQNQVQVTNLWVGPAKPKVLVVDDDQTLAHENAIRGALAANGVRYATYGAHPSYDVLKKYQAVVWSSGVDRYEGQLNEADRTALRKYLDQGGRVILTGNRIMDSITTVGSSQTPESAVSFGAQYFGVRTPTANPSYIISQSHTAATKGLGLLKKMKIVFHPSPARQFVGIAGLSNLGTGNLDTTIDPYGKATGIVEVPKSLLGAVTPAEDAAYLGVMVDGDKAHKNFKTAVFGWNLGENDSAGTTVKMMGKVMRHFGVKTGKPLRTPTTLIHHTAVRDTVSGTPVKLTAVVTSKRKVHPTVYFRRHDRGRFYAVKMKPAGAPGTWIATIPGKAVTPDGVDYYIHAGRSYAPYGKQGPLYHSIAVAMPVVKKPMKIKR